MKIQHVELLVAALSVALLFIAWSLLRTFVSSRLRGPAVSRVRAARMRSDGWRGMAFQKLRLKPVHSNPEIVRRRQLRPVSAYDGDSFASVDGGFASLTCQIEARMEFAFEQFSRGRISIRTYRNLVEIEADVIAERIAESRDYWPGQHDTPHLEPELDADLSDAMALVQWCLDWADDMMRKLDARDGPENRVKAEADQFQTA